MTEITDPTERGAVVWHSSEEDGGPDVGLSRGLGNGRQLWIGELSNFTLAEHGIDTKETGDGWWIAVFGEKETDTEIAGLVVDQEAARKVFEQIQIALAYRTSRSASAGEMVEGNGAVERIRAICDRLEKFNGSAVTHGDGVTVGDLRQLLALAHPHEAPITEEKP